MSARNKHLRHGHRAEVHAKRNPKPRPSTEEVSIHALNQAGANYQRTEALVSAMEKYGALHKLEAGNACLELAIANPAGLDDTGRLDWLNRAQLNWERTVRAKGGRTEASSGMALIQLAQLPTLQLADPGEQPAATTGDRTGVRLADRSWPFTLRSLRAHAPNADG